MYKDKTFLAIIPARAGSKGLPGKNIKELCSKPLIAWSIETGLNSKYIDKVIVSTDSQEIAEISKEYGAEIPFLRDKNLANDTASSFSVIKNVIEFYRNSNIYYDYIVLLEPTSPLRETSDIDLAIENLIASTADSIVGISKTEDQNPAFLVHKDSKDFISGYENNKMKVLRRQDIKDVFFFEGTIYVSKINTLLEKETFYHESTVGYEVPKYKSLEIDDIYDFVMVEAIMKHKGYNK